MAALPASGSFQALRKVAFVEKAFGGGVLLFVSVGAGGHSEEKITLFHCQAMGEAL